MLILVQTSPTSLVRDHGLHPNLGVLSSPRRVYVDAPGQYRWAADNDAYLAWDEDRYRKMLDKISTLDGCLFVTAPDVVGDHDATLERFHGWKDDLREAGLPIAFVAQDGIQENEIPWQEIQALFVGGTTRFKLSIETARLCAESKRRGLWVHMGRVNTARRIKYAASIGCDSIDGTKFSMFRHTYLPRALEQCRHDRQMGMAL